MLAAANVERSVVDDVAHGSLADILCLGGRSQVLIPVIGGLLLRGLKRRGKIHFSGIATGGRVFRDLVADFFGRLVGTLRLTVHRYCSIVSYPDPEAGWSLSRALIRKADRPDTPPGDPLLPDARSVGIAPEISSDLAVFLGGYLFRIADRSNLAVRSTIGTTRS